MTIKKWPDSERPREKLLNAGVKQLSDAELLAIFIQTGTRGKTAMDLARELLSEFGGLKNLLKAQHLNKKGLGKAKQAMLKAAVELGSHFLSIRLEKGEVLAHPETAKTFLENNLRPYEHEVFACLFLDIKNRVICFEELFKGTLHEANVYPREIMKRCLVHNAAKIILAHNHPSGNPAPSPADCELTKMLKELFQTIDVQIIDHVVIGSDCSFSFAEHGMM